MRVLFKNCSTWVGVVELIVIVVEFLVNCGGFSSGETSARK
jgi:hypothetical protein